MRLGDGGGLLSSRQHHHLDHLFVHVLLLLLLLLVESVALVSRTPLLLYSYYLVNERGRNLIVTPLLSNLVSDETDG